MNYLICAAWEGESKDSLGTKTPVAEHLSTRLEFLVEATI